MTEYQDPNFKDPNYKISEQQTPATENAGIIYLPVGPMKFTLMCLCVPFHAYEIWWLYKNFVCQKERGGKISSPLWRLNLPLLYLRKLLEAMRDEGKPYGLDKELPIEKIILYWCMLAVCLVFPPPASALGIFSFAPFIVVNQYLIKLNQARPRTGCQIHSDKLSCHCHWRRLFCRECIPQLFHALLTRAAQPQYWSSVCVCVCVRSCPTD
jgi:hypothetical protein